jgi:hypothetical protein
VTGRSKAKGDRAEREAAALLADVLGVPARRMLGAGRADDVGDIHGVPDTVIQVCDWQDLTTAVRVKPPAADIQAINAGVPFSVAMVRLRGGEYRMVMTVDAWACMWREATA